MALVLKDRVKETTTTTGTGTITLAGAVTGYQAFSVIGNANTTYYCIAGGSEWEVGIGTYTLSGTTLARTTILSSSNAGAAVNFSVGSKDVFVVYPAGKAVYGLIDDTLFNIAISNSALGANTTGARNLAAGAFALDANTTANDNVAVGYDALGANTTGFENVAVGNLTLKTNTTGTWNAAVGHKALEANTTGTLNTAIGYGSGSAITTGTKNSIIGAYTGNQGGLDIRTASNYIVLSDGDGNPRAYWNGANATFGGGLAVTGALSATGKVTGTSAGGDYAIRAVRSAGDTFAILPQLAGSGATLLGLNAAESDETFNIAARTGVGTVTNVGAFSSTGLAVTGSGTSTYSDGATYTLGILSGGASIARIGGTSGTTSLELMVNGSVISTHSLTGLAVTGTLSATANGSQLTLATATNPTNYKTVISSAYDSVNPFTLTGTYNGSTADWLKVTAGGGYASPKLVIGNTMTTVDIHSGSTAIASVSSTGLSVTGVIKSTGGSWPSPTSGQAVMYGNATAGLVLGGNGSSSDILLADKNGATRAEITTTGLAVTGTLSSTGLLTASAGLTSTYAKVTATYSGVQEANKGEFAFTTGNVEFYSYGPNAATPGGYAFITRSSNASVNVTPVTISSTGLAVTGALSATGTITSTSSAIVLRNNAAGTTYKELDIGNTGNSVFLGVEGSPTQLLTGATAYDSFINTATGTGFVTAVNFVTVTRATSTGLAVTGTISSTGSAGIGTTATANGRLSVLAAGGATGNSLFLSNSDGVYNPYLQVQHNGILGTKLFSSSSYGGTAGELTIASGGVDVAVFQSTGLAVTGEVSATTGVKTADATTLYWGAGSAYILGSSGSSSVGIYTGSSIRASVNNSGLAVTGTLSSTGNLTVTGGTVTTGSTTALDLGTSGGKSLRLNNTASAVNYFEIIPTASAGALAVLRASGSDTNVSMYLDAQAAGGFVFRTATGASTQVQVTHTASANRYITLTGSNGGNPTIGTSAGSLAVSTGLAVTGALSATGDISAASVSGTAVATQADQETATSTTTIVTPGRQQFHPSAAKVWGQAGVTGNLIVGYNVTSITDVGTGIATVVVGTDFSTDNVPISDVVSALGTVFSKLNATPAIGSFSITASSATGTPTDPDRFLFCAFGDQ